MMAKHNINTLKHKVRILHELGLTNSEAVREFLTNSPNLDEAASKLINNFFDGDMSYVDSDSTPEFYMTYIKAKYPGLKLICEDTVIQTVGLKGFDILRQTKTLDMCAFIDGHTFYVL